MNLSDLSPRDRFAIEEEELEDLNENKEKGETRGPITLPEGDLKPRSKFQYYHSFM